MRATASKSALVLSPCLRWAWDGAREFEDENADTSKRDKGTKFHSVMESYYMGAVELSGDADPDEWARVAMAWSKENLEPRCLNISPEVYVGSNFTDCIVHHDETVRNRAYPKGMDNYMHGTADLVCVLQDGSLLVADWKTGGGSGADKQLLSLAWGIRYMPQFLRGGVARDVRVSILYAGPHGVVSDERAVGDIELEEHRRLMSIKIGGMGVDTDPVTGIHCTQLYCPHLAYCPGVTETVDDLSEHEQSLLRPEALLRKHSMTDNPISDEEAGYVMEKITAARRQMKYYEDCIRKYVTSGGKAVAGDYEFKSTNSGFRWVKR